jgi:hypothetical protein
MRTRVVWAVIAAFTVVIALASSGLAASPNRTSIVYDDFSSGTNAKWSNPYGPGEVAINDVNHRETFPNGVERVRAVPFETGYDYSVYDHLKYMEISNDSFAVPDQGSVEFSSDMSADTPGTVTPLMQTGIYGPSGTWITPSAPPHAPDYSANVLQGQQAGVVMNMVDFCTGQLFDWFLSGNTAFTLIERLPTNVTGNTLNPNCPGAAYVGRDKMYTQIVDEVRVRSGPHHVSIRYSASKNVVEYRLDGRLITKVKNIGIPLDKQHRSYITYPSLGPGESLAGQIHSFSIGHGLFSLIDAFPYQHPEAPEGSVSIPLGTANPADAGRARLFGQGADGTWDNFVVTTVTEDQEQDSQNDGQNED